MRNYLIKFFGLDVRSLALFRISLGLILLVDLIHRSFYLIEHYTDLGVLPRKFLNFWYPFLGIFNIHSGGGTVWFESFLFFISALLALLIIFGYRTQLSTFISWILLLSLHNRNPIILSGADVLLRLILFWGLFLPLGSFFSIDSRRNSARLQRKIAFSVATFAYILQVCSIYWFSIGFKWNPDWIDGKAVAYALQIDQFATSYGLWLREYPALTSFLTYLTFYIELLGPFLVFMPIATGPFRFAAVVLFICLHLGFGMFLHLGIFPFVSIIAWIPLLPSWFWDRISKLKRSWSSLTIGANHFENTTVICLFVYMVAYNAFSLYPNYGFTLFGYQWSKLGATVGLNQKWNVFSRPLRDDGWYVIEGQLLNGELVDLYRQEEGLSWRKPEYVSAMYPNSRWRKYMMNIAMKEFYQHRELYARHLVNLWNEKHYGLQKAKSIRIYFVLERTGPDLKPERTKRILLYEKEYSITELF